MGIHGFKKELTSFGIVQIPPNNDRQLSKENGEKVSVKEKFATELDMKPTKGS